MLRAGCSNLATGTRYIMVVHAHYKGLSSAGAIGLGQALQVTGQGRWQLRRHKSTSLNTSDECWRKRSSPADASARAIRKHAASVPRAGHTAVDGEPCRRALGVVRTVALGFV